MYSCNCNQLFLPSILIPPPIYQVSCPVSTVRRATRTEVLVFPCHQVLPIPSCISYLTYFLPLPLNYTSKLKTRLVEKMWRFKERLNQGLLVLSSGRISCEGRGSGEEIPFFTKLKRLCRCMICLQPLPSHSTARETTEHCSLFTARCQPGTLHVTGKNNEAPQKMTLDWENQPPPFVITSIIHRNSLYCTHLHLAPN